MYLELKSINLIDDPKREYPELYMDSMGVTVIDVAEVVFWSSSIVIYAGKEYECIEVMNKSGDVARNLIINPTMFAQIWESTTGKKVHRVIPDRNIRL